MKKVLSITALFVCLSFSLSGFTACSNLASTQKVETSENQKPVESASNQSKTNYPPAPTGLMQADIKDLDGTAYKLEDKKGKVVLVNLWATWCGPCRNEMPELVAMQEEFRDKDFEILGLNVDDESVDEIKSFAEKMKLNYTLGYAENHFRSEMLRITRMSAIPQTVIINREGRLVGVFTGGSKAVVGKMRETVEKTVNES